jgi:putative aminopeptidase FrvX
MKRTFLFMITLLPLLGQDQTATLLQRLADAPGPPGFEEPVRKIMLEAMKPYVGSIKKMVKADIGIALEAGVTGDVFMGRPEESQEKLGSGPGLFLPTILSCRIASLRNW